MTKEEYQTYLKTTGQQTPLHLRTKKEEPHRGLNSSQQDGNARQTLIRQAGAELDAWYAKLGGVPTDAVMAYVHVVKLGYTPRLCSGMNLIPNDRMHEINTLCISLLDNSGDQIHGFAFKRNESKAPKKRRLTAHDYTGVNAAGEHVPFSYFINALISGKTKEFIRAKRKERKQHVSAVENPAELQAGDRSRYFWTN